MSDTKTAKIQNITKKEFNDQYKNWSYALVLDNEDSGFLSCKKEFSGGEEIEYTIETAISKAGKEYHKIKLATANGYSGRGYAASARGANESFALSYAKDEVCAMIAAGLVPESLTTIQIAETTCKMAAIFKQWLDDNKS